MIERQSLKLRLAVPADAQSLAAVHVTSWRETYSGVMPEAVLATLSIADRAVRWQQILGEFDNIGEAATFIAEDGDTAVGFGSCGRQRTPELAARGFGGEIRAIYVLRAVQGRGIGSTLMGLMAQQLLATGHEAASLWVLRENTAARRFYERLGGNQMFEKETSHEGVTLTDVAYGWSDLTRLSDRMGPRIGF